MTVGCLSIYLGLCEFLSPILLSFPEYVFCTSFVKLILPILFLWYSCSWDCFLHFIVEAHSYIEMIGFCVLILYPATWLNSRIWIVFFFLLVDFFGFSTYKIKSSAHTDSFSSFFPLSAKCKLVPTVAPCIEQGLAHSWCSVIWMNDRGEPACLAHMMPQPRAPAPPAAPASWGGVSAHIHWGLGTLPSSPPSLPWRFCSSLQGLWELSFLTRSEPAD